MKREKVIEFFNRYAPRWDADMIKDEEIVNAILDNAEIGEGKSVLDVAAGTGVLIPNYLERRVASVTAIDISPEMAKICAEKFPEAEVICGDAEETDFGRKFDCIMIYNAFPHFPEPEKLIGRLSGFLAENGTLTVAHGMSRERIDRHHEGTASEVSVELMHEDDLAEIFAKYLHVVCRISDDRMYQVTGKKAFAPGGLKT